MFLKVLDPEQIDYSRIKSIIVNESGTFIHAEDDYVVNDDNDDYEPITEEEWREQSPPVPEPIEPHEPAETIEQKLTRLESQNIILMDALATVYVETLGDKADDQTLTDLYTPLVEAGRKTVEQVPEKIKDAVHGRLSAKE